MNRGALLLVLVLLSGLGETACGNGEKKASTAQPDPPGMTVGMRAVARPRPRPRPAMAKKPPVVADNKSPRIVKQPQGMLIAKFEFRRRRNMVRVFSSSINNVSWVRITMTPDGKVTLSDKGKAVDRVTYRRKAVCRSRVEERKWRAKYKGTWKKRGSKLVLTTRRVSNHCTQVMRCDNRPPEYGKCHKISSRLILTCTPGTIAQRPDLVSSTTKQSPAWICSAGGAKTHTTAPWPFGRDQCMRRYRGTRGPFVYTQCVVDK